MELEPFELINREVKAEKLPSMSWRYIRKFKEKKEQEAETRNRMMLKSLSAGKKQFEKLAIELADISHRTRKIIEADTNKETQLQGLAKRISRAMEKFAIECIDPVKEGIGGELENKIRVIDNVKNNSVSGHIVGETLDPIVEIKGKVIRQGEVIGWFSEDDDE